MAISVVMPALEMAQETGKLLAWRKKEGEPTVKGEPLLEIETDKAVVEVEATADGILAGIKSREGDVVPVGSVIAWILQAGEALPLEAASAAAAPTARTVSAPLSTAPPGSEPSPSSSSAVANAAAAAKLSPKARRLAKEHGVDVSRVTPTGPDGSITTDDILAFISAAPSVAAKSVTATEPASETWSAEPLSQIARIMAERTTQSWTTVPHFFVTRELDATAIVAVQKNAAAKNEQRGAIRPTINDVLVALVARALAKHPLLNATWTGNTIRTNPEINISVAMAVKDGVVGAVIRNANDTPLAEIAAQRRELSERARAGKLRPADITGGTFTISNLGMFDVDSFTAIITPPQSAILAVGKIVDRVVAVGGQIAIRPMLSLTLSSDHRVVDGARAAEFLNTLAAAILKPDGWLT
ncbi:MAG: dihydrolipoamide acetyltransferase family protein [Candidatus Acidiferrum sp.]|jgi:pyruvate dehydrogenase E2 component (dihydrolipoamide acetyltransferase)